MQYYLILAGMLLLKAGQAPPSEKPGAPPPENPGISGLLDKSTYQQLFPHHQAIYSYEAFLKASRDFPLFAAEGSLADRKKEIAAFFANCAHETNNGGEGAKGGAYTWGLFYTEELACKDGHCIQYNTGGTSPYRPVAGKSYHGRGPLQISYAYNYGLAGEELGLPLLANPELVSTDGDVAFKTALWFWMRAQKPKPSCHEAITGKWQPSPEDIREGRRPGFGMTINIINGGEECNSKDPAIIVSRKDRIGHYKWFAALLRVKTEPDCDCAGMGTYRNM